MRSALYRGHTMVATLEDVPLAPLEPSLDDAIRQVTAKDTNPILREPGE